MRSTPHLTVEKYRIAPLPGEWVVQRIERGYIVRCGDSVLHSVLSNKPRVFAKLDTVANRLSEELGVVDFRVEAKPKR